MVASITRKTVLQDIVRELGGFAGDISEGTDTTAVLDGFTPVDELEHVGDLLVMPEAANAGDVEREVRQVDVAGRQVTFRARTTDTTYTNETYLLIPKGTYTLPEIREAANECLREMRRSYVYTLPIRPDEQRHDLRRLDWLRNDADVDAVFRTDSPVMLHNPDFGLWDAGTDAAPDGWTKTGTGATVARATAGATWGPYVAQLTRDSADAQLTQSLPPELVHYLTRVVNAPPKVQIGAWAIASAASRGRIGINDGSSTTYSSYHTGGGGLEWLTAELQLTSAMSDIKAVCEVAGGSATVTFAGIALVIGDTIPDQVKHSGAHGYLEYAVAAQHRNIGGVPVVDLAQRPGGYGSLVITSRRPYPEFTSDADETEADREALVSGALVKLTGKHKRGQDRTLPDRIYGKHARIYARLAGNGIDTPVEAPLRSNTVVGA